MQQVYMTLFIHSMLQSDLQEEFSSLLERKQYPERHAIRKPIQRLLAVRAKVLLLNIDG